MEIHLRARQGEFFPTASSGTACVHCGRLATTKDHVPAKCLLERPFPVNLTTVPSCRECNQMLGGDQEYVLAVLAQVSDSAALSAGVDRMLSNSAGLDERILRQLHVDADGQVFIAPEIDRLLRVARATAIGLCSRHYRVVPDVQRFRVVALGPERAVFGTLVGCLYDPRFCGKRWRRVQRGVFEYTFVRASWGMDLVCAMRFYETLLCAVECPYPRRSARHRLKPLAHPRVNCPWPGFTG